MTSPQRDRSHSVSNPAPNSRSPSPTHHHGSTPPSRSSDNGEPNEYAQVEQDLSFFHGPSSPMLSGARSTNVNVGVTPLSAARTFYSRHRNLSDASVDSQAAFIDHRSQPVHINRTPESNSSLGHRNRSITLSNSYPRKTSHALSPSSDPSASPKARPLGPKSERTETSTSQPVIQDLLSSENLEGSALDDDDLLGPPQPLRQDSHTSQPSQHSLQSQDSRNRVLGTPNPDHSADLSRRTSNAEPPEADVCFPQYGPEDTIPVHEPDRSHSHPHRGIPGMLPNFPFPFDFNALEEFAERDRDSTGVTSPPLKATDNGAPLIPTNTVVTFEDDPNGGFRKRSGTEGTPFGRRRKLSESMPAGRGTGRYQRKLALFEGDDALATNGAPSLNGSANVKTPLLADVKSKMGFGSIRPPVSRKDSEKDRPYRFSFYSNSLPSTVHARSLAEIPAEGQTFEDLFVGAKPDSDANEPTNEGLLSPPRDGFKANVSQANTPHSLHDSQKPSQAVVRSLVDAEANTWWLDVLCPTDSEMKTLGKAFGIHPLTIEDIQMEEAREKIELFRNYYLVCFRSFDQDPYSPTYLEPLNMYCIVFREGILSFHYSGTPHPQNVRRRIKQLKDYINVTADWISYALIDDITDAFGPLIQNIEYEVDSIDELVLILKDVEQSDMLRRIGTCRKKVMGLLRLMGNKADVIKGLAKRCNENWSVAPKSDIGLYLSDIQDHLITMTQNLNHYEKILSRSHSNYLAQISIEMTEANNQINDVLSKLTALGTVLIPMNLITGLWGMNVHVPGQDIENLNWFFSIVGCLLAFALLGGFITYRAMRR